jgi:hypothetical protein
MDTLDQGVILIPGRTKHDGVRVHQATQISIQFKTYEFFVSGVFPFNMFRLWLTTVN